jgi:hypothetical protein
VNPGHGAPNPEFARKFLIDGALVWVFLRIALPLMAAVFGGGTGSGPGAPGLSLGLPASITLVTLAGALVLTDVLRRRESVLLGNLGIPLRAVFITAAIPAAVAELATSLIAAMAGV